MKKLLVVGLGNPGKDYLDTRHNIGFKIINELANNHQVSFEDVKFGHMSKFIYKGKIIRLLKPNTFMNFSGRSIKYHVEKSNITLDNLLVLTDDIHLQFGTIRLRRKGSDGGHNGHKSIISSLATNQYSRLKFGIGNDFVSGNQSDYVLGSWTENEKEQLDKLIINSAKIVIDFCVNGIDKAMQGDFNNIL